jgi:hypothetical protein
MKTSFLRLFVFLAGTITMASAQTDSTTPAPPWTRELQTGINLNQAAYSDNWKSGGVNSVALSTFLNAKLEYRNAKYDWTNDLQLLYGNQKNKGLAMRKNADRIFLESKYAYRLTKVWNAFASATFMSQFDAGFQYYKDKDSLGNEIGEEKSRRISGFMSPGYLTEALGLEYKPVDYFSAQFGLGALRQSFVLDQSLYEVPGNDSLVLYGVKKGDKIRNQVVFQFVASYDKEILKNIILKARYMAILDYEKLNGQGIVHRFDGNITARVNKYINVNLAGVILYDFDQDHDVQYSQVLSLGVLYNISNRPAK